MLTERDSTIIKKRSLKKVRAQFLNKKEDSDEEKRVDVATKYLSCNNMNILYTSMGLVEMDRKISSGPQNINIFFTVIDSIIEAKAIRAVRLDVEENKDMAIIPWEYSAKRLESYGDLELATLAHRIRKFYTNLNIAVSQYEEAMRKNDSDFTKIWDETITKARKACEELEKNESYYKTLLHFTLDSVKTISTSYSEGLLRAIGFKPESFVKWSQKNGMPTILDPECLVFQSSAKVLFDFIVFQPGQSINQSMEYETYLYDSTGSKRKTLVTAYHVLEPVSDGFYCHDYFIIKDIEPSSSVSKTKYQESRDEDEDAGVQSTDIKLQPKVEENTDI